LKRALFSLALIGAGLGLGALVNFFAPGVAKYILSLALFLGVIFLARKNWQGGSGSGEDK